MWWKNIKFREWLIIIRNIFFLLIIFGFIAVVIYKAVCTLIEVWWLVLPDIVIGLIICAVIFVIAHETSKR